MFNAISSAIASKLVALRTTPGAVGVLIDTSGMLLVPITFWITVVTAPLRMQWAHGYSGCSGVLSIGSQVGARSVASLPSISPLRIAVIGRQNR